MRRIAIVVAVAVLAGSFVGCGNSNKSTQPQGEIPLQGDSKSNSDKGGKDKNKKQQNQPGGSAVIE